MTKANAMAINPGDVVVCLKAIHICFAVPMILSWIVGLEVEGDLFARSFCVSAPPLLSNSLYSLFSP